MEGIGHFAHSNGDETLTILTRISLKEPIAVEAMEKALARTALRYPNFHAVLASTGKGIVYKESNDSPVLQKENGPYHLGSQQLAGFPYRVSASGNVLTVSSHHGLSDGHGVMEFVKTLLFYYLKEAGKPVSEEGQIRLNEVPYDAASETEDSYRKYYDPAMKPIQPEVGQVVPFSLPVTYWDEEGNYVFQHFKLSLSKEEVHTLSKKAGASMTALINALINKAFQRGYDLEGKVLIFALTSNFRNLLPSDTLQNFSGWMISFYTPDMHALPVPETAAVMKGLIRKYNTAENALRVIGGRCDAGNHYLNMSLEELFSQQEAAAQEKHAVRAAVGYCLTNVGELDISESMKPWIEDMELYMPGLTAPIIIGMNSVGDHLTLSFSQAFADDAVVNAFCSICEENGLQIKCRNMGTEAFDTLGMDAVVRIDENEQARTDEL